MFEDDIDLRSIALEIANEPATREDGTPITSNGKPITKQEKILRSWAVSENPELQKRFMDLIGETDQPTLEQYHDVVEMCVMACCTTDQIKKDFLERLRNLAVKTGMGDKFDKLVSEQVAFKNRTILYIPHNGRDEIVPTVDGHVVIYDPETLVILNRKVSL